MARYRKKPVVIEAFKWTGGSDQVEDPEWIVEALKKTEHESGYARIVNATLSGLYMAISRERHELDILIFPGDYITRDESGALNKCSPDIFEASYDLVS